MVKDITNAASSRPVPAVPGTLLWVGDRTLDELFETYRFCETRVAQLALRRDLSDAVRRPAAAVRRILVTRTTREPLDGSLLRELTQTYPAASVLQLLGPLCGGEVTGRDRTSDCHRIHWHQANQFVPQWLAACGGGAAESAEPLAGSVAVVAATATIAEPLMDLAASAGVVAVWCRHPDSFRLRNVDSVWWDDSVTGTMDRDAWHQRMMSLGTRGAKRPGRHAWLVNAPNIEHCRTAYAAGVERILTKPACIEPLLEMLNVAVSERTDESGGEKPAATGENEAHVQAA